MADGTGAGAVSEGGSVDSSSQEEQLSVGDQARARIAQQEKAAKPTVAQKKPSEKDPAAPKPSESASVKDAMKSAADKKLRKYKVYGEEVEIDESRLDEYAQKGIAFEKRGSKLAEYEKKFTALNDAIEKGDKSAVKKILGDDRFHKFAVDHINELLEEEEMSPQERAYKKREQELKNRELEIKKFHEDKERQEREALDQHYVKEFDEEFSKAFEETKLPKHPRVMSRMVSLMSQNIKMGLKLPAAKIAGLVRQEITGEVKSLLGALEPAALAEVLGDEMSQRIRQHSRDQLRDPMAGNRVQAPVKPTEQQPKERPLFGKMEDTRPSKETWRERLAKIKQEG